MRRGLVWAPLAGFVVLLAIVGWALYRPADRTVRSAMIGKPVPDFALSPLVPGKPGLATADLRGGEPRLVNVFASWCVPCIAEAPQLLALKRAGVRIDGVAVRDTPDAIRAFLQRNGDPFERIGDDKVSAVQLALGSSGVPESFVIDGRGRIAHQHVGYIQPGDVPILLQAVRDAR